MKKRQNHMLLQKQIRSILTETRRQNQDSGPWWPTLVVAALVGVTFIIVLVAVNADFH